MEENTKELTGYPSIDRPWEKYYEKKEFIEPTSPSIYTCLKDSIQERGKFIAINYYGTLITYEKLMENIKTVAKAFVGLGARKGDIVTICTVTTPETIYMVYALNYLGAIANFIDPRTSEKGIQNYLNEVNSKYVVCIDVVCERIKNSLAGTDVQNVVLVSPDISFPSYLKILYSVKTKHKKINDSKFIKWVDFLKKADGQKIKQDKSDINECCIIEHTGGTTGFPKGVMLTNYNLNSAVSLIKNSPLPLEEKDIFLNILPPFVAYGMVLAIHIALCFGWQCVLIPQFNVDEFTKLILKYKPAAIMGIPTYFEKILTDKRLNSIDLSFIKCVLVGGDKINIDFENKVNNFFNSHNCNIRVSKGYSMTEASSTATFSFDCIEKDNTGAGIPFAGTMIAAFDDDEKEQKYNEVGELCIYSPTRMLGYYGKEKETHEILKTHSDGKVWIHTGDLGYVDSDGCIFVQGRKKRLIIRSDGFKVFPPMIEDVIQKHNCVEECSVVGVKDKQHTSGQMVVAYVVLNDKTINNVSVEKEIFELCNKGLPEYMQPSQIEFIDKLPLTSIGKVDFKALEERAINDIEGK